MVQLDVARRRPAFSLADDDPRLLEVDREAAPSLRRVKRQGACAQNVEILNLEIRQFMRKTIADDVELARLRLSLACRSMGKLPGHMLAWSNRFMRHRRPPRRRSRPLLRESAPR